MKLERREVHSQVDYMTESGIGKGFLIHLDLMKDGEGETTVRRPQTLFRNRITNFRRRNRFKSLGK